MKVRQLVTELYGDKAVGQLLRKQRGDYRPYLDREYDTLVKSEIEALAHGLYLHGTTNDITWAWDCWIKQQAAVAPTAHRSEASGWDSL